jgi:hypothetical protein
MGQDGTAAIGANGEGPGRITRRTLLGGAAAAGAASLIAPATGLASDGPSRSRVWAHWIGGVSGQSQTILAPGLFQMVGVEWDSPAAARIELRTETPDGRWGRWAVASVLGHDGDGLGSRAPLFGEPLWTGPARRVQLRADRPVGGVRVHFVSAVSLSGASIAAAPPLALPVLEAGPGQPPIIARAAWAGGRARPTRPPHYGTVKLVFIHHTVTPNGYRRRQVPAIIRSIFDYHVHVRGFWDIAYNFVIDAYGRAWEARAGGIDMAVVGAHAGAYNTESTGVAVIGDFMDVIPSHRAIRALQGLVAWKLSLHGLPAYGRVTVVVDPADAFYTPFRPGAHVSLPRVAGHRDGDTTDCPGNAFYHHLPAIRPHVVSLAGTPAALSLTGPSAAVPAGSTVSISGQLALLSGVPLAGAPIELQQPGVNATPAVTFATTTTAADGSWSASLSSETNLIVRALHRPYPASVADWVELAFAPILTLQLQSAAPLIVSGTVTPAKPRVTVALYPATGTTGKPLARRKVSAAQGQFTVQLPTPGPGTYLVVARTAGDASNAPGASSPLMVTVT